MKLAYIPSEKDADCTLEWWEGHNYPTLTGVGQDSDTPWSKLKLEDKYKGYGKHPSVTLFDEWNKRKKPCGKDEKLTLIDTTVTYRRDYDLRLRIKVVVKSGCPAKLCKRGAGAGEQIDQTVPSDKKKKATYTITPVKVE